MTNLRSAIELVRRLRYEAEDLLLPVEKLMATVTLRACFVAGRPYCFSFREIPGQSRIEMQLRISDPGSYNLEAFVKYSSGGQFLDSNKVAAAIAVG